MIAAALTVFVLAALSIPAVIVWAWRTRDPRPLPAEDARIVAWVESLHRRPEPRGTIQPAVTWQHAAIRATIAALGVITQASDDTRWPHLRRVWSDDTGSFAAITGEDA